MSVLISVIIPCYNEAANIKRGVLDKINKYLLSQPYSWEVLISDDGSTDQSRALARKFSESHPSFRFLENSHAGKPYALRAAIAQAKGKYVLFTDMDQSTPITEVTKLLRYTKEGYNVVIGSRGVHRPNSSFIRKYVISLGFLTVRRLILLPELEDTQCGFKLLEANLARKIFQRMRIFGRVNNTVGWKVTAYDVEMLHLAKKLGEQIKEVRVIWKDEDTSVGKKRNFIKESYEMLFEILRVRVNDFLGKYD